MVKLEREDAPDFWTDEKVQEWTSRWQAKGCESKRWSWPQHNNKTLNHHAIEAMEEWHNFKCAFCERRETKPDVEHFVPKTAYDGTFAYLWNNLFLSCGTCNTDEKGSQLPENALKPDIDDPSDYLWFNPISFTIEPIPYLDSKAKARAEQTIKLFGLNRPQLKMLYFDHLRQLVPNAQVPPLHRDAVTPPVDLNWFGEFVATNTTTMSSRSLPSEPFSLMVKYVVARFLRAIGEATHE